MLRYSRLARVYRILGECLDVGFDPESWRYVLAAGLRDLFDAFVVQAGEFSHIYDDERARVLHHLDIGWDSPEQQRHLIAYQVDGAQREDAVRREMVRRSAPLVAVAASHLVDFAAYRETGVYKRYMAPSGTGDMLVGITAIDGSNGERFNLVSCARRTDDMLYARDDARLMRVLMLELGPLVGTRLADSTAPIARLTPRQRDTLRLLLMGMTELQAAEAMAVSRETFHKYVGELYRHLGIRGRPALHAYFSAHGLPVERGSPDHDPRVARLRREGAPMARPWRRPATFDRRIPAAGAED